MLGIRYILLSITLFGLERVALFPLSNDSAVEEFAFTRRLLFLDFENPRFDHAVERTQVFDVPSFVMGLYRSYAKHDGTVKRNSQRIPATVLCLVGQGTEIFSHST